MAIATFKLSKCTGTNAATEADSSRTPKFLNVDANSTDTANNPVAVPLSGADNYSYEVWLRLECTAAPDNYCQTFKIFGPSLQPDSPANLVKIKIGTTGTGATPVNSASSVAATQQNTNYYDSSVHFLSVGVVPGDAKINAVGEKTNYIVLQLVVSPGATRGNMGLQSFYISYEEV